MTPLLAFVFLLLAQQDEVSRSWNQPVEPFRIAGNVYYVGANEITSYLITTPRGHIVLDGGFVETAPQIRRNIEKLGFRVADVKLLLNSHAHVDHAGGLAELKRVTGAKLVASARDLPQLARGGLDDPQFGDRLPFPPVYADRVVADGGQVTLGGTTLTAHVTAGHTRGCTTWTMTLRDGRDVVFLCSPSVPSEYKLVGNTRHPEVAEDYRRQFAFLKTLRPEIWLASHGNFFDLTAKRKGEKPWVDPDGYAAFVARMEKAFEERLAAQQQGR
ncbi:MAG TPA: subclass B3 metallo-beta-lactamase [Thermoanaerobaculia bacterium]